MHQGAGIKAHSHRRRTYYFNVLVRERERALQIVVNGDLVERESGELVIL